jgi:hypothetical protein
LLSTYRCISRWNTGGILSLLGVIGVIPNNSSPLAVNVSMNSSPENHLSRIIIVYGNRNNPTEIIISSPPPRRDWSIASHQFKADVTAPEAYESVSPAAVVLLAARAPHSWRPGVPFEFQISTPTMVVAGMLVIVTAPEELATEGFAVVADEKATVGAPVPAV